MEERSADPILQGRGSASGKSSGAIKVTVQPGSHRIKLRIWSSALEVKQQMREVNPVPVSWMRRLHNRNSISSYVFYIFLYFKGSRGHVPPTSIYRINRFVGNFL